MVPETGGDGGAVKLTVALADFVESAELTAVIVTAEDGAVAGAV